MKNLVVVDIDGTLANIDHRLSFIKQKSPDWNAFYEACDLDEPYLDVIGVVNALKEIKHPRTGMPLYKLIFVTGRSEIVRKRTRSWLLRHLGGDLRPMMRSTLLMRTEEDYRPDHIVKFERFKQMGYKIEDVMCVFEDRQRMVDEWRRLGVTVFQPKLGDY